MNATVATTGSVCRARLCDRPSSPYTHRTAGCCSRSTCCLRAGVRRGNAGLRRFYQQAQPSPGGHECMGARGHCCGVALHAAAKLTRRHGPPSMRPLACAWRCLPALPAPWKLGSPKASDSCASRQASKQQGRLRAHRTRVQPQLRDIQHPPNSSSPTSVPAVGPLMSLMKLRARGLDAAALDARACACVHARMRPCPCAGRRLHSLPHSMPAAHHARTLCCHPPAS